MFTSGKTRYGLRRGYFFFMIATGRWLSAKAQKLCQPAVLHGSLANTAIKSVLKIVNAAPPRCVNTGNMRSRTEWLIF